jgi:hypothetical protein
LSEAENASEDQKRVAQRRKQGNHKNVFATQALSEHERVLSANGDYQGEAGQKTRADCYQDFTSAL